jgi:type III pantothenate kinase
VPITYPQPAEIGQDRLANAAAAHALGGSPAVVIDSGTAVTFDIITTKGGYEGGIIAPGLELTRRYLHERTAQLPLLDDSLEISSVIGKSTTEAMRIGTVIGFPGLIQALLDVVLADLAARGEPAAHLFVTGGNAAFLQSRLTPHVQFVPDLTLRGLAAAYWLNQS